MSISLEPDRWQKKMTSAHPETKTIRNRLRIERASFWIISE